jgi:hypothetical protein
MGVKANGRRSSAKKVERYKEFAQGRAPTESARIVSSKLKGQLVATVRRLMRVMRGEIGLRTVRLPSAEIQLA